MRNPLRSEAEAFRFLIAVIVGALVIIGAAYVNTWLGVAAAVLAVGGIAWWLKQEPVPGAADPPRRITSETPDGVHRVLVVANETVGGEALLSTIERVARPGTELLVVAPAMPSQIRHWASDVDGARAEELVLLAGAVDVPALALVEAARARVVLEHPQEGLRAAVFPQLFDRRSHESGAGAAPPRLRQRVDRAQLARAEGHEADDAA